MPELVKIRPELFPKIYDAVLRDDDPYTNENQWRTIINYTWDREEDYTGYALLEGDKVIGMMAMVFRDRFILDRPHKLCNLHTWWVHEDYRGRSVAMLRPLLGMSQYTITHFTPCDRIRGLTQRLGFTPLDQQLRVLLPLRNFNRIDSDFDTFTFDEDIDAQQLPANDQKILRDHHPYRSGNLVVNNGRDHLYVLYTHVVRFRVNYCHIHYVSDPALFRQLEPIVRRELMRRHRVRFVILDARMFRDVSFKRSFDFWSPAKAVYKPCGELPPEQVDNLYSDATMLRLSLLPHISFELKQSVLKRIPFRKHR
ncbi:MAG: hypothetical protein P8J33_13430 [Pirellulaceae bacterium]|nr:hypothetical protein [Pirellulaceae bacterium]